MTWTRTIRVVSTDTVTLNTRPSAARTGTAMAVGSIICVQTGLALTVPLFGQIGPLGAVWLRLAWAAVVLLVVIRPRPWRFRRPILLATVVLGAVTAGVTILFMEAVVRLPLGTATALEFLGPLGVAVARGRGGRRLLWPGLAAAGVVLLTHPWQGGASPSGIACALGAAVCWACYPGRGRWPGSRSWLPPASARSGPAPGRPGPSRHRHLPSIRTGRLW